MAMASRKTLELFYDVLSPYSWIAFEVALRYRTVWNINLDLKPFLLGGIKKATGNTPPGMLPPKAKYTYMVKDLTRLARHYNLAPITQPQDPVNVLLIKGSLSAMRLLTAAKITYADKLESLSRALWKRVYNTDEDIASPESLIEVCLSVGLSPEESKNLLEESRTDIVKAKLKESTERALRYGSFGAPTILVDDANGNKQMFFGCDRFPLIADVLGVQWQGSLNPEASKL